METFKCKKCGSELPLTEFSQHKLSKTGHMSICKRCLSAIKSKKAIKEDTVEIPRSSDPRLAGFEARELMAELRRRGYKGRLEYHVVKTIDL